MTEYNKIFRNAFDRITPASSDADFIGGIIERADKMEQERKNTNSTVYRSAEESMPQVDYKPRKAPIVAGVAALTAAAAGIGFFAGGANFGDFHFIPLKEGGGGAGAGYSAGADTDAATTTVPVMTEDSAAEYTTVIMDTAPTGIPAEYDLGGLKVTVNGYEFDSAVLKLYFDVEDKGGNTTDGNLPAALNFYSEKGFLSRCERLGDSNSYMAQFILYESDRRFDVAFAEPGGSFEHENVFTAVCDDDVMAWEFVCGGEDIPGTGIGSIMVSPYQAVVYYDRLEGTDAENEDKMQDERPEIEIRDHNGVRAEFSGSRTVAYENGKGYLVLGFVEQYDNMNTAFISVNGVTVYDDSESAVTSAYYEEYDQIEPYSISFGDSWEGYSSLGFTDRDIAMTGWEYDGRILKVRLAGTREDFSHFAIRSLTNPRNIIQTHNKYDEETGTGIFYAILDVPAGEYDTVEFIDLGADMTGNYPEAGNSLTIKGIEDSEPLMERVGLDMTEYGMPGLTLEWLTLSPFGLELSFTGEEQFDAPEIRVDITSLNGTTFRNSGYYAYTLEDEETGIYHTSVIIVPEDYMTDLTQMREFSINGLKTKRAEFMAKSFWDIPESENELTPVETAVQVLDPEE